MEGEREESAQSGATSTPADAPTHSEASPRRPGEGEEADGGPADEEEAGQKDGEGPRGGDADVAQQEAPSRANTQGDDDCLPLSPPPTEEEEASPPPASSHPASTQNRPSEPCWYCLRSLDPEYRPQAPQQEDSDSLSAPPSSGQKVSYQTDPRPHFGVAWSSHSPCRPLWGSEGPCWGHRNQEVPDQTHTCPHCHLGLAADTLRWHEAKCLLFEGLRSLKK